MFSLKKLLFCLPVFMSKSGYLLNGVVTASSSRDTETSQSLTLAHLLVWIYHHRNILGTVPIHTKKCILAYYISAIERYGKHV